MKEYRDNKNIGIERKSLVFLQCVHDGDQAASWHRCLLQPWNTWVLPSWPILIGCHQGAQGNL